VDALLLISIWLGIAIVTVGVPAYVRKKAENLATREDVAKLTRITEGIRQEYAKQLESVKTVLARESEALVRRRDVYHALSSGLRVFVSGHQKTEEETRLRGEEFLSAYVAAWLWAPDDVIRGVNAMIDLNLTPPPALDTRQLQLRSTLVEAIVRMRRDVGFSDTELGVEDFRFAKF